jgi:nucleotide-binding universal stress UspA family protein
MADFKCILFPVDFSHQCALAAPYVVAFARHFNADVDLLHSEVLPVEPYVWEPQTELLTKRLKEFADENFSDVRVRALVTTGYPAEQIVHHARANRTDLIMMPTHGRGPFRRFVLGSVTTKVLHDTHCPVWTSAHLDLERPPAPPDLRNVLCAVDLDETGEHTIRYAGGLAKRLGSTLTIAHAVPAVETLPGRYMDTEFEIDLMEAARTRLFEMQATAGTNGIVCVGAGNIARFVAQAARSHRADLVVIGRGGNGMMERLRTHDYAIIRECESPVLSI